MTVFVAVEHGECEIRLCKYLSEWLRTDIVPVSRNKGAETISLRESGEFLKQGPFKDLNALNKYYKEYKKGRVSRKLKMSEITIFVIMDVDSDRISAKSFRSKDMFRDSPFYERIVPVLSDPDLDTVMKQAGFDIPERNKPKRYSEIFDSIESVDELESLLQGKDTDIPKMIEMIKEHCPDFQ